WVASWELDADRALTAMHPCEFRGLVVRAASAMRIGLGGPLGGAVEIRTITGAGAEVGPFGVMRADVGDGNHVVALAVDGGDDELEAAHPGVSFDRDTELVATLAHACYRAADASSER